MISMVESCLNLTLLRTIEFVYVTMVESCLNLILVRPLTSPLSALLLTEVGYSGTSLVLRRFVCDSELVTRETRESHETRVTLTSPSLLHLKLQLHPTSVNNNRASLQNSYTIVQHTANKQNKGLTTLPFMQDYFYTTCQ